MALFVLPQTYTFPAVHSAFVVCACQIAVAYPGILFRGCSTNSVQDRGQREQGYGGGSP